MTKRFALIVVVLVAAAACGTKSAPGASSAPPTASAAPTRSPAPAGQANMPLAGTYRYALSGLAGTKVPSGAEISETITITGKNASSKVTNNENASYSVFERRWSPTDVEILSTTTYVSGRAPTKCTFKPPVKVAVFPLKAQTLPAQNWSDPSCSGTTNVRFVDEETMLDANGHSFRTWKIIESTATVTQTHWFSPDLGVDVKDMTHTPSSQTQILLEDYPSA